MTVSEGRKAWLATEDGLLLEGRSVGAEGQVSGTLTFDTAMVGYLEAVTNPDVQGQILVFAMTHIGNYGANEKDALSESAHASGVVVREMCFKPSNWTSEESFPQYLTRQKVVAIDGIDTRMLTRHIRDKGPLGAVISTHCNDKSTLTALAREATRKATQEEESL